MKHESLRDYLKKLESKAEKRSTASDYEVSGVVFTESDTKFKGKDAEPLGLDEFNRLLDNEE
ncbi:hypothetical protein [Vibrio phage V-YDF132]|nr:hypothetical protein [Vibrio phage V-YDF132]